MNFFHFILIGCWLWMGVPSLGHAMDKGLQKFHAMASQALQENPRIRTAEATLRAVREKYDQAWAGYLPQVSASVSQGYQNTDWNAGQHTNTEPGSAAIVLSQTLYNRSTSKAVERTEPHIHQFEWHLEAERQDVLLQVTKVTLNLLESQEVQKLAKNSMEVSKRNQETVQARFRAGETTQTDVSRATAQFSSTRAEWLQAVNNVAVAEALFQEATGQVPPQEIGIPVMDLPVLREALDALLMLSQQRPLLRAERMGVEVGNVDIDIEKAGNYPVFTLNTNALHGWNQGTSTATNRLNQWTATAELNMPLYTGGGRSSRIRDAQARQEALLGNLDRIQRQVQREVTQASKALKNAQAVVTAFEVTVKAAQQTLTGVEHEYRVGLRTSLDLMEAQNGYFSAQTSLVRSRYTHILRQFELLSAIGQLTLETIFPT